MEKMRKCKVQLYSDRKVIRAAPKCHSCLSISPVCKRKHTRWHGVGVAVGRYMRDCGVLPQKQHIPLFHSKLLKKVIGHSRELYVKLFGFDSLLYCIYSIYSGRRAVYLPEQDGGPGQGMRHALSKNNVNALLSAKRLRHLKHFWTCKLAMCRVIIISRT